MKTAPSEELQGVAEEIVEVDVDENKIIGDPNAPNKDTNTCRAANCCSSRILRASPVLFVISRNFAVAYTLW